MPFISEPCRTSDLADVMQRIRCEYQEMPGLRLTVAQARRLWNLDREQCEAALTALIGARVLRRTRDGSYVLA